MYSMLLIFALSGFALVSAQSEATPNPTIPTIPTSTDGIPTIEGALVYDGPPVIGYTGTPLHRCSRARHWADDSYRSRW